VIQLDQILMPGSHKRTGVATSLGFTGLSRPNRNLAAGVAALAVCLMIAAGIGIASLHREAWRRTEHDNRLVATALAEYTGVMLRAVDMTLKDIALDAGLSAITTPEQFRAAMGTQEMNRSLAARQSALPQVLSLSAVDAEGGFVNVSRVWPPPVVNLSDRGYFKAMQAADAPPIYVSEPVLSRTVNEWVLILARRVSAADGRFLITSMSPLACPRARG